MKKYLLIILLLISVVSAADLSLKINGQQPSEMVVVEKDIPIEFELTVQPFITIIDVEAKADNKVIQTLIDEDLDLKPTGPIDQVRVKTRTLNLPKTLPGGEFPVDMYFIYEKDGKRQEVKTKLTFDVQGSSILGFITNLASEDTAYAIRDLVKPPKIELISRDIEKEDLTPLDLSNIGLSRDDVLLGNYNSKRLSTLTEIQSNEDIESDDPNINKEVSKVKRKEEPKIEKILGVFEVTNPDNGKSTIVSKIIVSLEAGSTQKDLEVIEYIPKSVAMHVDDISWSKKPQILQEDPIVKWDLGRISKKGVKEVSYAVNEELQGIDTKTVAGGEKLGLGARFLAWLASLFLK